MHNDNRVLVNVNSLLAATIIAWFTAVLATIYGCLATQEDRELPFFPLLAILPGVFAVTSLLCCSTQRVNGQEGVVSRLQQSPERPDQPEVDQSSTLNARPKSD